MVRDRTATRQRGKVAGARAPVRRTHRGSRDVYRAGLATATGVVVGDLAPAERYRRLLDPSDSELEEFLAHLWKKTLAMDPGDPRRSRNADDLEGWEEILESERGPRETEEEES